MKNIESKKNIERSMFREKKDIKRKDSQIKGYCAKGGMSRENPSFFFSTSVRERMLAKRINVCNGTII